MPLSSGSGTIGVAGLDQLLDVTAVEELRVGAEEIASGLEALGTCELDEGCGSTTCSCSGATTEDVV